MSRRNIKRHQKKLPNEPRPCLVCKTPHVNNQPFCSAKCCEDHRAAKGVKS